jgi:hypothetical protein
MTALQKMEHQQDKREPLIPAVVVVVDQRVLHSEVATVLTKELTAVTVEQV